MADEMAMMERGKSFPKQTVRSVMDFSLRVAFVWSNKQMEEKVVGKCLQYTNGKGSFIAARGSLIRSR